MNFLSFISIIENLLSAEYHFFPFKTLILSPIWLSLGVRYLERPYHSPLPAYATWSSLDLEEFFLLLHNSDDRI